MVSITLLLLLDSFAYLAALRKGDKTGVVLVGALGESVEGFEILSVR